VSLCKERARQWTIAPGARGSGVRRRQKNVREEVEARGRAGDSDTRQGKVPFNVASMSRAFEPSPYRFLCGTKHRIVICRHILRKPGEFNTS
jgi:hypothetical protein